MNSIAISPKRVQKVLHSSFIVTLITDAGHINKKSFLILKLLFFGQ